MQEIKIKCGNLETTIKIQRPSFSELKKTYVEISKFDVKAYNERFMELKQQIVERFISNGYNESDIEAMADNEANLKVTIEIAKLRYVKAGGVVEKLFMQNNKKYVNTCALGYVMLLTMAEYQ